MTPADDEDVAVRHGLKTGPPCVAGYGQHCLMAGTPLIFRRKSRGSRDFIRIPCDSFHNLLDNNPVSHRKMNLQNLQAQLNQLERKRQQLEKRIKDRASKQYAALPKKVGLKNIDDLIIQLLPYGSSGLRSRLNQNGAAAGTTGKRRGRPPRRSRGTRYTADVKAAVKRAVEAGGRTVAEISREFGPSVFSIKDWKKQWGL